MKAVLKVGQAFFYYFRSSDDDSEYFIYSILQSFLLLSLKYSYILGIGSKRANAYKDITL